jgi:hypothetical protein
MLKRETIAIDAICAVMDIVVWLRSLGLGKYETAFCEDTNDDRTPSSP